MGIDRYMTIAEAIYYWDVSKYKLNKRLQDDEFIMPYVEEKLVKFFDHPENNKRHWIISQTAMEHWYGQKKR